MTGSQRRLELYQAANQSCAEIILSDIARYGGEESLMVQWAQMVLAPPAERTAPAIGRAA